MYLVKKLKFEIVPLAEVVGKLDGDAEKTVLDSADTSKSQPIATANSHKAARTGKPSEDAHTMRVRAGSEAKRG